MGVLAPRLRSIEKLTLQDPLYARADARAAIDGTGWRWAAKGPPFATWQTILAEAISWMVGQSIGVPLPDAGIYQPRGDEPTWLSRYVEACSHFSTGRAVTFQNYLEVGRILALDAIVGNGDRHAGNILLCFENHRVVAIDHDKALIGFPTDFESLGLSPYPPSTDHPSILLFDEVRATARDASQLAVGVEDREVAEWVQEGCALVGEVDMRDRLTAALVARMKAAPDVVEAYFKELERFAK